MRECAAAILAAALLLPAPAAAENGFDRIIARLAERSWVLREPARSFFPGNLYEEIDGEAELFLPYDFRRLDVAYLSEKSRPGLELRLEIYLHGSSRDAFGIFSQHRFPGQDTIPMGASEAIVSDASLDFFRGSRFVRIRATSLPADRETLVRLGRAISGMLEGTGGPPKEAEALLVKSFVPGTLVYQKKAILGHAALAPGYEAKFSAGGTSGSLLLMLPPRGDVAIADFLEKIRAGIPGVERVSENLYRAPIPGGILWIKAAGKSCIGVAGNLPGESAERLLSEIAANLK